jgi:hypothetical protein
MNLQVHYKEGETVHGTVLDTKPSIGQSGPRNRPSDSLGHSLGFTAPVPPDPGQSGWSIYDDLGRSGVDLVDLGSIWSIWSRPRGRGFVLDFEAFRRSIWAPKLEFLATFGARF